MSAPGPDSKPARAWQRMLSGRRLNLLDPAPADIEIEDIAHGLSRVARWNGQTSGEHSFSVAQHSLAVEQCAALRQPAWPTAWRLAALLHDAPEYVIGDLISPFKSALGLDYKTFENRLLAAIHLRFGLPASLPGDVSATIKQADRACASIEARRLAGFAEDEAAIYFGDPNPFAGIDALPSELFTPWSAQSAQAAYLKRFLELAPPQR